MTPGDIARILAAAAARDNRTIGDADVLAWHEDIGDLDYADALAAVSRHYRRTADRLMPSHVRDLVAELIEERRREALHADWAARELAAGPEPDRGPIHERSEDVQNLVRQLSERFSTPDAIHERARLRARHEKGRPEPLKRRRGERKPAKDWPPPMSDDIAALATRYLLDGHTPADVADRLAVSKAWCRKTLNRIRRRTFEHQEHADAAPAA